MLVGTMERYRQVHMLLFALSEWSVLQGHVHTCPLLVGEVCVPTALSSVSSGVAPCCSSELCTWGTGWSC